MKVVLDYEMQLVKTERKETRVSKHRRCWSRRHRRRRGGNRSLDGRGKSGLGGCVGMMSPVALLPGRRRRDV